jgi:molybdate transport system ATP-binding protein
MTFIECKFNISRNNFKLNINTSFEINGITAILGKSGCGKTTFLNCLAGLTNDKNGFLKINKTIIQNKSSLLPTHNRKIGYVFQDSALFKHLNVLDNITYAKKRSRNNINNIDLDQIIDKFKLNTLLQHKPHQLSGGEKQRVAIARAIASSPELLLMDEPLSSIDYESKFELLTLIQSIKEDFNLPILYVTHSITEVARISTNAIIMNSGKITQIGNTFKMLTNFNLPISEQSNSLAVIHGKIQFHDNKYHLTDINTGNGIISVKQINQAIGSKVKILIKAKDVSIATERPMATSILNIIKCNIIDIKYLNESNILLKLNFNNQNLISRITKKSFNNLNIEIGKIVYAQIKSVAIIF